MKKPGSRTRAKLFVVSAPSGCGKTTLCNRLLADGLGLANSVSMTTRSPRPGEKAGFDYRFVSRKRFKKLITKRAFLEHEENFGNLYGTPRKFIQNNLSGGVPVLLSIDVKGAMKVQRAYPRTSRLIFVLPPSIAALRARLEARSSDGAAEIARRLGLARKEIAYKRKYDHVIVNDRLDASYKKLKKIITEELEG